MRTNDALRRLLIGIVQSCAQIVRYHREEVEDMIYMNGKSKNIHGIYDNPGFVTRRQARSEQCELRSVVNRMSQRTVGPVDCAEYRVQEVKVVSSYSSAYWCRFSMRPGRLPHDH